MQPIEGVYVANVTPFRDEASLSVDVDSYLAHVSWLDEMGVRGVVPFGTNGEGPSVTLREKLRVLEALFGRGLSVQVIPAVMQGNLPDTLEIDRKSTRLNSSHANISYAVFCLKKMKDFFNAPMAKSY